MTRMRVTRASSCLRRLAVASKPVMTQAWRPAHMTSPTGRPVRWMASAARSTAASNDGRLTRRYRPRPRSVSAAAQPAGLAPPYGLPIVRSRAISHSRRCEARDSLRLPSMIERAIWMLAPTHHSNVYWRTKSAWVARLIA